MYPLPSVEPPRNYGFQFFAQTGRPNIDGPLLMTPQEFADSSVSVCRGCYGLFDSMKKEERQFGRTLYEVLSFAGAGLYQLVGSPVLHWVTSPQYGVRPLVFVVWIELQQATQQTVRRDVLPMAFSRGR